MSKMPSQLQSGSELGDLSALAWLCIGLMLAAVMGGVVLFGSGGSGHVLVAVAGLAFAGCMYYFYRRDKGRSGHLQTDRAALLRRAATGERLGPHAETSALMRLLGDELRSGDPVLWSARVEQLERQHRIRLPRIIIIAPHNPAFSHISPVRNDAVGASEEVECFLDSEDLSLPENWLGFFGAGGIVIAFFSLFAPNWLWLGAPLGLRIALRCLLVFAAIAGCWWSEKRSTRWKIRAHEHGLTLIETKRRGITHSSVIEVDPNRDLVVLCPIGVPRGGGSNSAMRWAVSIRLTSRAGWICTDEFKGLCLPDSPFWRRICGGSSLSDSASASP